jgi:hypothetical protein
MCKDRSKRNEDIFTPKGYGADVMYVGMYNSFNKCFYCGTLPSQTSHREELGVERSVRITEAKKKS